MGFGVDSECVLSALRDEPRRGRGEERHECVSDEDECAGTQNAVTLHRLSCVMADEWAEVGSE